MFIEAPDFYGPDLGVQQINWTLDRPTSVNVSEYTGKRTIAANPWHGKWTAHLELCPVVGDANVRAMRSFIARCRGSVNTFRLPATVAAQNDNGDVTVAVSAIAGATTLNLAGYTYPLLDGQFATVNGQLLQLTADQAAATITFEPPLRQDAPAGTLVITTRPFALVYMANSALGWSLSGPAVYGISFDFEEAVLEGDGVDPELFDATVLTWDETTSTWDET